MDILYDTSLIMSNWYQPFHSAVKCEGRLNKTLGLVTYYSASKNPVSIAKH
jgi:hypothetical protein